MASVADYTDSQVKAVAAAEVLGAVGLILPALLDIAPILVPIAATGLALMMVGAVTVHLRRGDGVRQPGRVRGRALWDVVAARRAYA